jgi:uncharacterized coiled-coil DUF342 family protein
MKSQELAKKLDVLENKAHDIESMMHSKDTGCMTERVDELREELIDVTMKIDEIKEELGQCIEVEY